MADEERHGDFAEGERTEPAEPGERDFAEGVEQERPGRRRDFGEGNEQERPGRGRDFGEGIEDADADAEPERDFAEGERTSDDD
jgi:hypothetical protein